MRCVRNEQNWHNYEGHVKEVNHYNCSLIDLSHMLKAFLKKRPIVSNICERRTITAAKAGAMLCSPLYVGSQIIVRFGAKIFRLIMGIMHTAYELRLRLRQK